MPQQTESQARHLTEWGLTVGGLGLICAFWFSMRYAQEWVLPPLGPQRTVSHYSITLSPKDRFCQISLSPSGVIDHPPGTSPEALPEGLGVFMNAFSDLAPRRTYGPIYIEFVHEPWMHRFVRHRGENIDIHAITPATISNWIGQVTVDRPDDERQREASELFGYIQFLSVHMKSMPLPSFEIIFESPESSITFGLWRHKKELYQIWWALCGLSVIWWLRRTGWLALAGREAWNHRRQAVNTVKSASHFACRCFVRSVRYVVRGY